MAALVGASVFAAGLVLDPLLSLMITTRSIGGEIDASYGYASLALVVFGLCVLTFSATTILTRRSSDYSNENPASSFDAMRDVLSRSVYSRLFAVSAVVYAGFYAFASGIIVYNPNVNFSSVYHVSVPSSAIATCCSTLGQTPLAVVYLTEHVGLLIVPVNLLLLFLISWLVGLNAALDLFVFSIRIRNRGLGWLGVIGAMTGLFTSCPTCAGLALLSILSGTGALSLAVFFGYLQTLLIVVSIPILVVTPMFVVSLIRRNSVLTCPVR